MFENIRPLKPEVRIENERSAHGKQGTKHLCRIDAHGPGRPVLRLRQASGRELRDALVDQAKRDPEQEYKLNCKIKIDAN